MPTPSDDTIHEKVFEPVQIHAFMVDYVYDYDDVRMVDLIGECEIPRLVETGYGLIRLEYDSMEDLNNNYKEDMKALDDLVNSMRNVIRVQDRILSRRKTSGE